MDKRDRELDKLLEPLQKISAKDEDLYRWKESIQLKAAYQKQKVQLIFSVAAALLIGVFIGQSFPQKTSGNTVLSVYTDSENLQKKSIIRATKVETFVNMD